MFYARFTIFDENIFQKKNNEKRILTLKIIHNIIAVMMSVSNIF